MRRPHARSAGGRWAGPLAAKICATAASLLASAARPYPFGGQAQQPLRRRAARARSGDGRGIVQDHGRLRKARCPAAPLRLQAPWRGCRGRPWGGDVQVPHLAAVLGGSCRTGAGGCRAGQHLGPGGVCAVSPWANHRSPSRLSMTAALCWRGCVSGRPAMVRTCSSNCETSQAFCCSGRCCAGAAPSR